MYAYILLSTWVPFPNKVSCFVSTCVSSDNSFPSVRQEPGFGPWKGSPFLQQMETLVGLFFTETHILTARGTQGPACLPMDQTQQLQLGPFCLWSPLDTDNWPECQGFPFLQQMDLEIIMLNELSQKEKDKASNITYMWNLKYDTNEFIYEIETES